jgi:hypothetical protein
VFAEDDDLHTTRWRNIDNTRIEQFFFAHLDNDGQSAVEYFCKFQHPKVQLSAARQRGVYRDGGFWQIAQTIWQ